MTEQSSAKSHNANIITPGTSQQSQIAHSNSPETANLPSTRSKNESLLHLLTPGRFLFLSSVPLGLGAYIGYRRALKEAAGTPAPAWGGNSIIGQLIHHPETKNPPCSNAKSSPVISNPIPSAPTTNPNIISSTLKSKVTSVPPPILAARALVIGSLLSLSGTSLLVASIFILSDCNSVEELVSTWRTWGPKKMRGVQTALGIPVAPDRLESQEYEKAVKGMTEDQEWEYVKMKYGPEIHWDGGDDADESKK